MRLAIGIIVYNPNNLVLERVKKYLQVTNHVFIYDNSEEPGDISKQIEKKVDYYINEKNKSGLTGALTELFNVSKNKRMDYLLTMDQDSDMSNESIYEMLKFIENCDEENISIYCPNYRKIYGDGDKESFGKIAIKKDENKYVNFSMTSASFCKVDDIYEILPLSNLFIGYVDNEICYSLIKNNKKILMIGSIIFNQRVGNSVKGTKYNKFFNVLNHSPKRYYYMTRNNLYLQEKFDNEIKIRRELRISLLRIYFNIVIGEKNKLEKIKYSFKGYKDYKNGKYGK